MLFAGDGMTEKMLLYLSSSKQEKRRVGK